MLTQTSAIETANTVVPVAFACNQLGMSIPDLDLQSGRSYKTWCPWGEFSHDDGGTAKAFRVYPDTNSAWCFACAEYFTPVKLYAQHLGVDQTQAAEDLLRLIGHRGVDVDARWAAAVSGPVAAPDPDTLSTALKTYCDRICSDWSTRQFDEHPAAVLSKCLGLLPYVRNTTEAAEWLSVAKQAMTRELTQ